MERALADELVRAAWQAALQHPADLLILGRKAELDTLKREGQTVKLSTQVLSEMSLNSHLSEVLR